MSKNVEKKRKNGYYWVWGQVGEAAFMVQVADDWVLIPGDDEWDDLARFERDFEFASTEPLKPLVKP